MKKPICLITLLLLLLSIPSFTQVFTVYPEKEIGQAEIIVTYNQTFQQDSLNPRKRQEKMTLLIGKNTSSFFNESEEKVKKASQRLSTAYELQEFINDPRNNVRVGLSRYRIFKNYPEGKITTTDHFPSDHYLYTENLKIFNWKLSGETDSILDYKVQKATANFAGRDWVAWFTPEIPYNDGPYKFNGLPGLILKIHDTRNHYLFEAVLLEKPGEEIPIYFTERSYITTTKEGFFRAWNSFRESIYGRSDILPEGHSRNIIGDNLRRHNNPIELIAE